MLRVLLHRSCGPVLLQLIRLFGDSLKERANRGQARESGSQHDKLVFT